MNRNRFKKKSATNFGLSSTANTTNGEFEDDEPAAGPSNPCPTSSPSTSTRAEKSPFVAPLPSPKRAPITKRSPLKTFRGIDAETVTKRKRRKLNQDEFLHLPFFERVLRRCGLVFELKGDTPHTLDQESIFFVRSMNEELGEKLVIDKLGDFVDRFKSLHEDDPRLFKKSMLSIQKADGFEGTLLEDTSLIHLLLQVEPIQAQIMQFVFDKLAIHLIEAGGFQEGLDDVGWTTLILNQIRGISYLVDSKEFTKKVLEVLEIANPKTLVIFLLLLPEFTFDENEPDVATALCKLLTLTNENAPQILDALGNLTASTEARVEIMETLTEMLQTQRKFMPQVIHFMLTEGHQSEELPQVISTLRDKVMLANVAFERDTSEQEVMVKVIRTLKASLGSIREAQHTWITLITADKKVSVLDLAVLVEIFELGDDKVRKTILSLVKSKSAAGVIEELKLEQLFKFHGNTLAENISVLECFLQIPAYLLESPDKNVLHHGALWFKFAFLYIDDTLKRRTILRKIVTQIQSESRGTQSALWVLSELVKSHMAVMLPFASQLMLPDGMLPRVKNVCPEHARQIMDVMCRLAYSGDTNNDTLQGDISMLISKQLAMPALGTKRKGIVGAVMAVKHLVILDPEEAGSKSALSESSDSCFSLPSGPKMTQAQELISLVRASVKMYPEALGFFMDELASMVHCNDLHRGFTTWLSEEMVNQLQDDFTIDSGDDIEQPVAVKLGNHYTLDGDTNPIVVCLGKHIVQQELVRHGLAGSNVKQKTVFPNTMCALFRLVRMLKYYVEEGNLDDIDALLGCAIQVPDKLAKLTRASFAAITDPLEQDCVLNSLFLMINWLREVVNAFIYVRINEVENKVLQRVRHIVMLEKKLMDLLPVFPPDFTPPLCQFYASVKPNSKRGKPKAAKKKKRKGKKRGTVESSLHPALDTVQPNIDSSEESQSSDDETVEEAEESVASVRAYLRELDMPIFIIFSQPFNIHSQAPQTDEVVTPELGPAELVFLLEDYSLKLEHHLLSRNLNASRNRGRGFQRVGQKLGEEMSASEPLHFHLDRIELEKVAVNSARIVKPLCEHLEKVMSFFQELQDKNDGVRDGPGSDSELAKDLSRCFYLILKSLKSTFAWEGFYNNQRNLLIDTLRDKAAKITDSESLTNSEIISTSCRYLQGFGDYVPQLPTAVALVSLMQVVASHDTAAKSKEAPKNHLAIRELCEMFLKREWPPLKDTSTTVSALVAQLVSIMIDSSEVKLAATLDLLNLIKDNADDLTSKNAGFIEDMQAISKSTVCAVFEVLSAGVASGSNEASADPEHLTQTQGVPRLEREMSAWNLVIEALQAMVAIAKQHDNARILKSLFKHSQRALQLFMEHGMKVMDKALRKQPREVQMLLKKLQTVTRFLQSVCCYGKVKGALGLVQSVPMMRYLLERVVQRVKAMLVANRCTEAFWMGNLKNRNLKGEEIQTQVEEADEDEEEDSEDDAQRRKKRKKSSETQATNKSQAGPSRTQASSRPSPTQGSSKAGPSRTQAKSTQASSKAGPSRTQTAKAGPSRTQASKAGPSRTQASKAGPSRTQASKAGPSRTQTSKAGPSQAKTKTQKKTQVKPMSQSF